MKIYLAGFQVFSPEAEKIGKEMKALCRHYGLEGLYPLDNVCDTAEEIFQANTAMIHECDIIAANMNPFRGAEPDSGTAFELGYACALGKKLYCYLEDTSTLQERLGKQDGLGYYVEDFGLPLNLMAAVPAVIVRGGLRECLEQILQDRQKAQEQSSTAEQ